MASAGAEQVIGLDLSSDAINTAKKYYNHESILYFNENIYDFNSKNNIDSIVDGYFSLPKLSKFLNLWKRKCFYIQDENYKELINNEKFLKKNFIYLDGFFQEI